MDKDTLKLLLSEAILCWHDDNYIDYNGIDDENFIKRVCEKLKISEEEYDEIMSLL